MVYTELAKTAAVSCGASHVSAVSTPLRWVLKMSYKKLFTDVESLASAVKSARERRTVLYKSDQQQQQQQQPLTALGAKF